MRRCRGVNARVKVVTKDMSLDVMLSSKSIYYTVYDEDIKRERWGETLGASLHCHGLGSGSIHALKVMSKSIPSSSDWHHLKETLLSWWAWPRPGWLHPVYSAGDLTATLSQLEWTPEEQRVGCHDHIVTSTKGTSYVKKKKSGYNSRTFPWKQIECVPRWEHVN